LRLQRENIVTWLAVLVIAISVPFAIVDTNETGRVYIFSMQFLGELPGDSPNWQKLAMTVPLARMVGSSGR